MYRNTFVNINLNNLKYNIETIKNTYNFKYYFGVVKADCYGNGIRCVKTIIDSGCNYLAVSSLDEALQIRPYFDIPILCLGIIDQKYLDICKEKNITITIPSLNYLKEVNTPSLKVHLKIDTGMNRLGVKTKEEIIECLKLIKEKNLYLEGVYTHLYESSNEKVTNIQINKFNDFIKDINVDIVHISASEGLKYSFSNKVNGCRLGIIMYGFTDYLKLKDVFTLHSEVIEIKKLNKGETIGYNGIYKAEEDILYGVVPIGYADGINRKYTGGYIYINNKKYQIIGNICMDMLMVKIDESVKIHDKVYILKNNKHIKDMANYIDTIPYEVMCDIGKRVPRVYE